MGQAVRVLMIDDDVDDVELARFALRRGGLDATVTHVFDSTAFHAALEQHHDVVLCDSRGLCFEPKPVLAARGVPFIALSGLDTPEARLGAAAFVGKRDMVTQLAAAVLASLPTPIDPPVSLFSFDASAFIGSTAGALTAGLPASGTDGHRLLVGVVAGALSILMAREVTRLLDWFRPQRPRRR